LCAGANQILLLLDPLILRRLVDNSAAQYKGQRETDFFLQTALLLSAVVGIAFAAWVARNFQLEFANRITRKVGARISSDGIRHSLGMPYSAFEARQSGEIVGRIQKARHEVERFLTSAINTVLPALISLIFVMAYASRVHWSIMPAFLVIAPALALGSGWMSGQVRRYQKMILDEMAGLSGSATEAIRNIELVKSLGLAGQEVQRLNARNDRILQLEIGKLRYIRRLSFFQGACVNLLRVGLLMLFLYLIHQRQMTVGQFFSLFLYAYFIFTPMQEMGPVMNLYFEAEGALNDVKAILESPQESRGGQVVPRGQLHEIRFNDVHFRYHGSDRAALNGISFRARRGETIAFAGPSGAGKTTIVKLLTGLYAPDSGNVLVNDFPLTRVDLDRFREQIGLVTQDPQLFSSSIRDNLLFACPEATDAECLGALEQASVTSILHRANKGLDTLIGEGGLRISGGEKQRLSIARAILRSPDLIVFDEATSSLDSLTEAEVAETVRAVCQSHNAIAVFIAHRLSTILHADRIYVLDAGRIAESGSHTSLLAANGLYTALWRQQMGQGDPDALWREQVTVQVE
jgi:ATP-binding cassette subfamily B protein